MEGGGKWTLNARTEKDFQALYLYVLQDWSLGLWAATDGN